MRLKDRIAIVTGGGGGIGGGICKCLARAGADIVVSDLNLERAEACVEDIQQIGRQGLAVQSDVTNEADCKALIVESLEKFGRVDILVNNAGHFGKRLGPPFMNQTGADWDDNFAIHVKGPFFLCKALAPHLIEQKFGKIINISSIAAKRDPQIAPAYAAAKNALLNLTRVVAKDLGPHNINVNAVCPGMLWTGFWHRLAPLIAETNPDFAGLEPRALFEHWVKQNTPMQREQTPEDIGNLIVFLASEEARNITGQAIHVDGGAAMG
jgi:meso-butanediol dehydrogenase / (S,S)-butanediol dehydrogenase / diacetyl reductase